MNSADYAQWTVTVLSATPVVEGWRRRVCVGGGGGGGGGKREMYKGIVEKEQPRGRFLRGGWGELRHRVM